MTLTVTAREFNQDVSAAKRAAEQGPVVVTDRGTPAYVLITFDEYKKLTQPVQPDGHKLVNALAMEEESEIDFEPITLTMREADF